MAHCRRRKPQVISSSSVHAEYSDGFTPQLRKNPKHRTGAGILSRIFTEKDKFGDVVGYALNQEKYLWVFLTDGDVPIDNNASERAIRGFCIGKNYVLNQVMYS